MATWWASRRRSADGAHQDPATWVRGWLIAALLLGTAVYAIAEEVTLTTYYPSPRGVYKELRVGSGNVATPTAKLQVTLPTAETGLALRVDDQDGDTTSFLIDQDGNVGIGTTGPAQKLHVAGSGTAADIARIRVVSTDNQAGISFLSDSAGETVVYSPDGTDDLRLYVGGDDRLSVASGGNVGIGTTGPGTLLDVAGTIRGTGLDCPDCVALSSETTGNYAAGDAEAGNAIGLVCTDCVTLSSETIGGYAGSASEGGPATTALALDANGSNCAAGQYAQGVDASGNAEGCASPSLVTASGPWVSGVDCGGVCSNEIDMGPHGVCFLTKAIGSFEDSAGCTIFPPGAVLPGWTLRATDDGGGRVDCAARCLDF